MQVDALGSRAVMLKQLLERRARQAEVNYRSQTTLPTVVGRELTNAHDIRLPIRCAIAQIFPV